MQNPVVLKIGGNDLAKPGFMPELAAIIAELCVQQPFIIIHGGGRAIDDLMQRLGIQPVFVEGQRVTNDATLEAAEMMLSGRVNKDLTLALLTAGVDALGMSGVDRGLIIVEPWDEARTLGRVGRIKAVRGDVLTELCLQNVVPILSPISAGADGRYNVNADHAAGEVAKAVNAHSLTFLTNVSGVQDGETIVPELTATAAERYIDEGVISGGMIPKVRAALAAVYGGVRQAVITDLNGLRSGTGTIFHGDDQK